MIYMPAKNVPFELVQHMELKRILIGYYTGNHMFQSVMWIEDKENQIISWAKTITNSELVRLKLCGISVVFNKFYNLYYNIEILISPTALIHEMVAIILEDNE